MVRNSSGKPTNRELTSLIPARTRAWLDRSFWALEKVLKYTDDKPNR